MDKRLRKAVTLRIKPELYDSFKSEASEAEKTVASLLEERIARPKLLEEIRRVIHEELKYHNHEP